MEDMGNFLSSKLSVENILMTVIKMPGVKIHRSQFLHKELIKYYAEDIVQKAIDFNPAKAGISLNRINTISLQVINYETIKATGVSVAASLPSAEAGMLALGAATADITSYFAFILRAVQELAYLYGFYEFELDENSIDTEMMNFIIIFLGVMFGASEATLVLAKFADIAVKHVSTTLARKALTKGIVYPVVKKISSQIGIRMTKQVFADTVASAIPIAGMIASGGLTFALFKPCCLKLRKNLMSYNLCKPEYYLSHDSFEIS